jgi:hypothetical protein
MNKLDIHLAIVINFGMKKQKFFCFEVKALKKIQICFSIIVRFS